MWVGPSQGAGLPAYIIAPHPQVWPFSAMALPAAVAGPWLCLLLLLGVPLTLGASIAGGLQNVPVSDPEVQKAAHAAEQTYNQRSKSPYYSRGMQVLSAQRQVSGCRCYRRQGTGVKLQVLWVQPQKRGLVGLGSRGQSWGGSGCRVRR
uniref:Cystatin domain-containing protein n=1 Tax=Chelydra serpentina TaxID=8475 RepID=A0A8C3S927_CHESE